jgi:hypothetical protein
MWLKLLGLIVNLWSRIMARSISDIPTRYRHATAKEAFIKWLADLPVHHAVKRKLIADWSSHTHVLFSWYDYVKAGLGD